MIDEIYDRTYQSGREQLHAGIDRGLDKLRRGIGATFRALHKVQFAAPWSKQSKDAGCA